MYNFLTKHGQISNILVPIVVLLYIFYPKSKHIFFKHIVCIGCVGIIEMIFFEKYKFSTCIGIYNNKCIVLLIHIALLVVLFNFKKYWSYNIYSILILILANVIIIYLPWWPYYMSRKTLIYIYNITYLSLLVSGYVLYN